MRRDTLSGNATTLASGYVADNSGKRVRWTFAVSPSSAGRVYNTRYTYGLAICLGKGTYSPGPGVCPLQQRRN